MQNEKQGPSLTVLTTLRANVEGLPSPTLPPTAEVVAPTVEQEVQTTKEAQRTTLKDNFEQLVEKITDEVFHTLSVDDQQVTKGCGIKGMDKYERFFHEFIQSKLLDIATLYGDGLKCPLNITTIEGQDKATKVTDQGIGDQTQGINDNTEAKLPPTSEATMSLI